MDFNQYLNQAWTDHAENSLQVSQNFQTGLDLLKTQAETTDMAHLMTHVMGTHLGNWSEGVAWLKKMAEKSFADQEFINRSIAVLELSSGKDINLKAQPSSEQIRILSSSANALMEQKNFSKAQEFFTLAVEKCQLGLAKEDPANRSLAIAGHGIACVLEGKSVRSSEEVELMILAAEVSRKYWEIAGKWLQVERAEYRLANTYLKAGNLKLALDHAQECIEISKLNEAPALELFFGFEVLALIEKARQNQTGFEIALTYAKEYFEKLEATDKIWCEKSLKPLLL
jgi:tetratricopeptide (TPR) repeat protein